jgi:hypothetical protein
MPCTAISPKRERFQPPRLLKAIGTGIGMLTPTMPSQLRLANSHAVSRSRVKMATPLPYSCSLTSLAAGSRSVMTVFAGEN